MIKHDFALAGKEANMMSWPDDAIARQIASLECVIAYFEERRDAGIMLFKLRLELNSFRDIANERKLNLRRWAFFRYE